MIRSLELSVESKVIIFEYKYDQLVNELLVEVKKSIQEGYLILLNSNKRFIDVLNLNYDYKHRRMTYGRFYHHKGIEFTDISYNNTTSAVCWSMDGLDIIKDIIKFQAEMLYQHLLYLEIKDSIRQEKCYQYRSLIAETILNGYESDESFEIDEELNKLLEDASDEEKEEMNVEEVKELLIQPSDSLEKINTKGLLIRQSNSSEEASVIPVTKTFTVGSMNPFKK